jgi:hypothetical protein
MPKLKTYKVTDAEDVAKMTAGVNKILKTLGLNNLVVAKAPSLGWLQANAANHQVDVIVEASVDPASGLGPVKVTAKAGGQTSVMAVYTFKQAMDASLRKSLKASGLM